MGPLRGRQAVRRLTQKVLTLVVEVGQQLVVPHEERGRRDAVMCPIVAAPEQAVVLLLLLLHAAQLRLETAYAWQVSAGGQKSSNTIVSAMCTYCRLASGKQPTAQNSYATRFLLP